VKRWWPPPWAGARSVRLLGALLLATLPAWGQGPWFTTRGKRVPLPKKVWKRYAPWFHQWRIFPGWGKGKPDPGGKGLEGLLAKRVSPGRSHYDPGAGARTCSLRLRAFPGDKGREVLKDGVFKIFGDQGNRAWRVAFEKVPLKVGRRKFLVWHVHLAEALSFEGMGGRKGLILDGDGDGWFCSPGKDLLLLYEGKEEEFLPLTETAVFRTGAYDLSVDRDDRVSWRVHGQAMGILRLRPVFSGSSRLISAVVGTGRVFRLVRGSSPAVPVPPGDWFLYWGRIQGGIFFQVPYQDRSRPGREKNALGTFAPPGGGKKKASAGIPVRAVDVGVLPFGAPFRVSVKVEDLKERLVLSDPVVRGARGEVYGPDPGTFGKGEVPLFSVVLLVGRISQPRRRSPLPWVPWSPAGKGSFRKQKLVIPVAAHWAPLQVQLRLRRGPMAGALGLVRVR